MNIRIRIFVYECSYSERFINITCVLLLVIGMKVLGKLNLRNGQKTVRGSTLRAKGVRTVYLKGINGEFSIPVADNESYRIDQISMLVFGGKRYERFVRIGGMRI